MQNTHEIAFHCLKKNGGCGHKFRTTDHQSKSYPERVWLPTLYVADCPHCDNQASQAAWQLGQWKAIHDNGSAGPATERGRLAISKANQERDPESYRLSRFNALSHGMSSEIAKYYPARPGDYPQCSGCDYLLNGCGDELKHCAKRTELFVQFHLAQEEGDGSLLGKMMASTQAGMAAIVTDMIQSIAIKGVALEKPEYYIDKKTGSPKMVEFTDEYGRKQTISEITAHPLLPHLINFIQKNNTTLGDMGLTPAAKEETRRFNGFLDAAEETRESAADARRESNQQMELLRSLLKGSSAPENPDIIDGEFIEHDQ